MPEYFVRLVELPRTVEGVTVPNDDGSFDVYINSLLCEARRKAVLEHELLHLKREHFYLDLPIAQIERQADGERLDLVLHPPEGKLACFTSEAALALWLKSLARQQHLDLRRLGEN